MITFNNFKEDALFKLRFAVMDTKEPVKTSFLPIPEGAAIKYAEARCSVYFLLSVHFKAGRGFGFSLYRYLDEKRSGVGPSIRFQIWRKRFGRFVLWGRDKIKDESNGLDLLKARAARTIADDPQAHVTA